MDPDATLALIAERLEALQAAAGDADAREGLAESLRDLAGWIERGGLPPRRKLNVED